MAARMEESLVSTKSWDRNNADEETQTDEDGNVEWSRDQSEPLLLHGNSQSYRLCSKLKYRKRGSVGKGALLIMASSIALHVAMPYNISSVLMKRVWGLHYPYTTYESIYKSLWIVFPLAGLVADAKFGRYKVITCSTAILLVASVMMLTAFLLFRLVKQEASKVISSILVGIAVVLNYVGYAGYDANIIQFLTDQTTGASGEELSGLINLYFWVSAWSQLINVISSDFILDDHSNSNTGIMVILTTHFILCSTTLYCFILLKKCFDATPKILNPIKLLYDVLAFAKENKYPRNRSALTLWEDTKLTRIDMAKSKYGGPFTEEEVEDVKTGLRLLPIIFLTAGVGLLMAPKSCITYFQPSKDMHAETKFISEGIENALLTIVFVPVYLYFIYPIFYKYIPSLLKRVGLGILLVTISLVYLMALDPIAGNYEHSSTNICFLSNVSIEIDPKWCLPNTMVAAVGELLIVLFAFEFIVAQSPQSMKGLAIGLWFAFYAIIQVVCINLQYPFKLLDSIKPSCGFYYFLTKSLISTVFLIAYMFLTQRYTMRVRDCPVNVHLIAEDHYTKYLPVGTESTINNTKCDTDSSTCSSCGSN